MALDNSTRNTSCENQPATVRVVPKSHRQQLTSTGMNRRTLFRGLLAGALTGVASFYSPRAFLPIEVETLKPIKLRVEVDVPGEPTVVATGSAEYHELVDELTLLSNDIYRQTRDASRRGMLTLNVHVGVES